MKIKELKINGFGKLENKEIKFNDKINVVYGANEAGKSTLLKFVTAMFYGLSKNKNGQNVPDIEKFRPWKVEEFSGKLKYEMDNKNTFEIYRDFKKKNPKIFNENLEDISKEFNIDKTKGNQFFYDQTGLEEEIFLSSVVTKQTEVKLDEKSQNNIIQKISNILGTGEDSSSYEKIVSKLKKKINEEIGTSNTKEKPINIIEKRIEQIEKEKLELERYQDYKFEIEEEIKNKKNQIVKQKEKLETLKAANIQLESVKSEETKINVAKKLVENTKQEILNFEKINKKENTTVNSKLNIKSIVVLILLVFASILAIIFAKNIIIKLLPAIITIAFAVSILVINKRKSAEVKVKRKEYKEKLRALENKLRIQEEESNQLEKVYNNAILEICKKYNVSDVNRIIEEINKIQSSINELTLTLHTTEIDNNNIRPKLERYINFEEELESLKEDRKELERKRFEIQKTIEVLELAYNKMKEEVTPKFTEKLSKTIYEISNGK